MLAEASNALLNMLRSTEEILAAVVGSTCRFTELGKWLGIVQFEG